MTAKEEGGRILDWKATSPLGASSYEYASKKAIRSLLAELKSAEDVVDAAKVYISTSMGLSSEKVKFCEALAHYKDMSNG